MPMWSLRCIWKKLKSNSKVENVNEKIIIILQSYIFYLNSQSVKSYANYLNNRQYDPFYKTVSVRGTCIELERDLRNMRQENEKKNAFL